MNEGYGGFSNRETWIMALWADNDEPRYRRYWEAYKALESERGRESAVCRLAEIIRADVEDHTPLQVGVYADLLRAAIWRINWREVAERFADG